MVYFKSKLVLLHLCPVCCSCPSMPSKENHDAVDSCELDLTGPDPSGPVAPGSRKQDGDFRDQLSDDGRGDVPWEKRYEKLWVEVEKKEVKSNFRNVAGELKERFGELLKARQRAEEAETAAQSTSAEEESSDEDEEEEGELILRPTARARSTVLLTIPEQRESGLDDSESTDRSERDDRTKGCERPASQSCTCPDPITDEESRSPSPQPAPRGASTDRLTTASPHHHPAPGSDVDSVLKNGTKLEQKRLDHIWEDEAEAKTKRVSPEEAPVVAEPSPSRPSASVRGVSDNGLEVGAPRVVLQDLDREKARLHKEVEDGCPLH